VGRTCGTRCGTRCGTQKEAAPRPVTFLRSPSVTVTSSAVGTSDEFARLTEANNPSLGSMGTSCLPDSKISAGGAQKAPPAASSAQSMQLASQLHIGECLRHRGDSHLRRDRPRRGEGGTSPRSPCCTRGRLPSLSLRRTREGERGGGRTRGRGLRGQAGRVVLDCPQPAGWSTGVDPGTAHVREAGRP
jgi:hypothetical protein